MFPFITVLIISILVGAEIDLFIPSFPELQRVFDLSPVMVQLTLSVNFIALCLCSLFARTLGDRFDRRHVICISLFLFIIGSCCCVSATHYMALLLGRFLQGAGIAGPMVLAYAVLADEYPLEKQPEMLGILNGMTTLAMAFAPVVGSFVNLYFNWRGNFFILLGLGLLAFLLSLSLPSKGDPTLSLSLKAYKPLLCSPKLTLYILTICALVIPYWMFVAMAPIYYMKGLGVPLQQFGYYQGALALVFSVVSILSPRFLRYFGQNFCFRFGTWVALLSAVLISALLLLNINDPLVITGVVLVYSFAVVFPINILYPFSLEVLPHTKGRASALIQSLRLLLTAGLIELVSYFYHGVFLPIGITMMVAIVIAFFLIQSLLQKKWIPLSRDNKA